MKPQESKEEQTNNTTKKEWITPEMTELKINGGIIGGIYESTTTMGQHGILS